MIKDYQDKEVLAEKQRQVNVAAKISDREASNQKQQFHNPSSISKPRRQQARKNAIGLHSLASEFLTVTV